MNHKWGKILKDKDGFKYRICLTCGCKKNIIYGVEIHSRSGIIFNHLPECIDEEFENTKTID